MTRAWLLPLLVAAVACNRPEDPAPAPPAPVVIPAITIRADRPAELAHVTIKALGMNCPESCPLRVREALAAVPDVYELGFDLDHEAIYMSYDAKLGAAKQVTRPMIAAIKNAGFDPWLAKESWPDDAVVQVVAKAK